MYTMHWLILIAAGALFGGFFGAGVVLVVWFGLWCVYRD